MRSLTLDELDPSWHQLFTPHLTSINSFLASAPNDTTPERPDIFRVFRKPLNGYSVVVFGQDPYPGVGVADGLAFSARKTERIPASLKNIFTEYVADLGFSFPSSTDLTPWMDAGVLLLNRTLTTVTGGRNVHRGAMWNSLTNDLAEELGMRDTVAILWGSNARELGEYFTHKIVSAHPSPLSLLS